MSVFVGLSLVFGICLNVCLAYGAPDLQWWQTSIIYQIYPRSFKDSNGDGIGDLKGIISKLDYFIYLGVKAIWLSPFYPSPNTDFGYDISNHTDVDMMFGTIEEFRSLLAEAHNRDIKVIVDFVPNHTSDQHPWFQASIRREEPYTNFYTWTDGKAGPGGSRMQPNNWISLFGGTAWTWNNERQQFYYHAFLAEQPDLNYRNPRVVDEMNNVVRFWVNLGVDGIRVDAILYLLEVGDIFKDEPDSKVPGVTSFQYESLSHIYTSNLPEVGQVLRGWRQVLDEFVNQSGKERLMIVEAYDTPENRRAYLSYGCHLAFNFDLIMPVGITSSCGGRCMRYLVDMEYSALPKNAWPNFVLGNHDRSRIAEKRGIDAVNAFNMLLLTLKGTPTTYYGEEIGMEEIDVSFQDTQDPFGLRFGKLQERYREFSRDPVRSPLQWNDKHDSGFTTSAKPWLPIHPNYKTINIENQMLSKSQSPLQLYKKLAHLRQKPAFQFGDLNYAVVNDNIFSYTRHADGYPTYLVCINFGKEVDMADYRGYTGENTMGRIIAHTGKVANITINLDAIVLLPDQGFVVEIINTRDEL